MQLKCSTLAAENLISACTLMALAAGCLCVAGCSSSSSSNNTVIVNPTGTSSLPTPSASTASNTYIGTQGPGVWSLSLDDTTNTYTYQPLTFPSTPVAGAFTSMNGFLSLGQANGSSLGYILEVQGRLAMLRPGNTTAPLVVGVPQTSCYPIPYRLRFEYIGMNAANNTVQNATAVPNPYGSVVANTNADGSTWQYQNLQGNAPFGAAGFSGACAVTNGQAAMSLSGEGLFDQYNYSNSLDSLNLNVITTMQMGPSGIFIVDQSDTSQPIYQGSGVAGVAQPSAPLATANVAAGQYLGFLTEAPTLGTTLVNGSQQATGPVPPVTSPVSFGLTLSTGATMVGGAFPNDDVTQTPNADTSITLGTQDSTINGFYPSASVTTLDPAQNCTTRGVGSPGTNALGFFTCTYPAVAVVGNPEGKYAIFLTTYNYTAYFFGTAMQIYLYQQ